MRKRSQNPLSLHVSQSAPIASVVPTSPTSLRVPRLDPHTGDLIVAGRLSRFITNRGPETVWYENRHNGVPQGKIHCCSIEEWLQWARSLPK